MFWISVPCIRSHKSAGQFGLCREFRPEEVSFHLSFFFAQGSGCDINASHTQGSVCENNASLTQGSGCEINAPLTPSVVSSLSCPDRGHHVPALTVTSGGRVGFDVAFSGTPFGSTPATQLELFNQFQLSLYRVFFCSRPGGPAATRPAATRPPATPSLFLSNQLHINTSSSRSLCGVKPQLVLTQMA